MNKIITLLTGCLITAAVHAQGVQFEQNLSWRQIKAKAKETNKLILVDAYTTWCGPCKQMSRDIFPLNTVGDFINPDFIAVKVQMDQTSQDDVQVKGWYEDAKELMNTHEVTAFPTFLFLTSEGKLVHKAIGYRDADAFIRETRTALDNGASYVSLLRKFEDRKLDTVSMRTLLALPMVAADKALTFRVSEAYIRKIPRKAIYEKPNLLFIGRYLTSKSRYFQLFSKEPERINQAVGKNYAETSVMAVINREEILPYTQSGSPDWAAIERRVVAKYGALGQERVWGNRLVYYWAKKDWPAFGKCYKQYFDVALPKERSVVHINNISWKVFEHINDTAVLNTAVKAMNFTIDKYERYDPAAMDTYANLLYKLGRKEEAITWQTIALRLSGNEKGYQEALDKMKEGVPTWNATPDNSND